MLSIRGLVTAYGNIEALRGISLDAAEGEITCLLGPNGAGKTTTMFTIAGILAAKSGSVVLDGEDLVRLSAAKVVSRGIALVPENRLVFPRMDVEENLHAGAYARRAPAAEIAADIADMYRRFPRLEERKGQLAGTLSGGEQQMLAIARGLMTRPRILLMDEPSVGLAPLVVEEIFGIIRELNADGSRFSWSSRTPAWPSTWPTGSISSKAARSPFRGRPASSKRTRSFAGPISGHRRRSLSRYRGRMP